MFPKMRNIACVLLIILFETQLAICQAVDKNEGTTRLYIITLPNL